MATVNLTRLKGRHKKRDVSVFTTRLVTTPAGEVPVSGNAYELFTLPPNSLVVRRNAYSIVANNTSTTAVADLGFAGGDQLGEMDLKAAAGAAGFAAALVPKFYPTGGVVTFTPVYTGTAATTGEVLITIEYIEIEKTTGDVTNFSST